jgi:GDP-4-dehydro-6-deoxy-D-mannose reductase
MRDLLDTMMRASRTAIRVEVETDRLRPSDNPVIVGDRTRISSETGWEPRIPITRTLEDLLDYWRLQTSRQS